MTAAVLVSLIIPTFNRGPLLGDALRSIAAVVTAQDPVEIIIIDNGSTDGTAEVCRQADAEFPQLCWRYIYDGMPGLLTGRHRGAREARGELLVFLDDDVILSETWLEGLREAFSDPEVMLAGGPSFPRYQVGPPSWLEEMWTDHEGARQCSALSLIDTGPEVREANPCYIWGLNFGIRRAALEMCGGFHPDLVPKPLQRFQGDGETGLALKAANLGLRALHHPKMALWHMIPASRLTPEAFEQRGFYQGVCDSYTSIRSGQPPKRRKRSWIDWLRPLKRKLHRTYLLRKADGRAIKTLMARARAEGVWFHQEEVLNDPDLYAWVTKPDYLDYALPEGWRDYLQRAR